MSPLEVAQWLIAEKWAEDIDLSYEGVNLAEAMKYEVLRIVGALMLEAKHE